MSRNVDLKNGEIEAKRSEIIEYFKQSFELFEKVFECLANDDVFYERPERRRHQLIFYFGHTAVFYINKLFLGGFIEKRINPYFESIFAIGVDEMAWDDLNNNSFKWPSVNEVREYRNDVKNLLLNFIANSDFQMPITWESPMWALMMGCEHERIHLETSSVLHRQLPISKTKTSIFSRFCKDLQKAPLNELIEVPSSIVKLGKTKQNKFYGWDNEYGEYITKLPVFKASKFLVSNGEFLEFVEAGGYQNDEYWSEEGRRWKNFEKVSHPPFWIYDNGEFYYRFLSEITLLPLNFPVDVNCLEAEAFCNWKSKQLGKFITLPTEAMWNRLADYCNIFEDSQISKEANINLAYFDSSCPVDRFCHGEFFDVVGNVWQWTRTPIDSFDGFEVHPLYDDFSTPTFDGKHAIIKGGSWISTGNEIIKESRFAFRRHFYQHAGFRYYEIESDFFDEFEYVEKDNEIIEAIKNQYGSQSELCGKISTKICDFIKTKNIQKALDLGCGVGRLSFEMTKCAKRVFGIDFSARFIRVADHLKKDGFIKFEDKKITLSDVDLDCVDTTRLEYWQADACNLRPTFNEFDFVIAHDLLSCLYDFEKFSQEFYSRVIVGAFAIFSFSKDSQICLPQNFELVEDFQIDNFVFCVTKRI